MSRIEFFKEWPQEQIFEVSLPKTITEMTTGQSGLLPSCSENLVCSKSLSLSISPAIPYPQYTHPSSFIDKTNRDPYPEAGKSFVFKTSEFDLKRILMVVLLVRIG